MLELLHSDISIAPLTTKHVDILIIPVQNKPPGKPVSEQTFQFGIQTPLNML